MIRFAPSAASKPEPSKAREVSATEPAIEMPRPKPVIELAAAAPTAGLLLPSSEASELDSDTLPKTAKPLRRAATKRKPKVAEADDTPLQLSLEA
ncbi:poly(hydroxyalkanoate) granule-associated protein [Rhizobium leguminosarum]|uniref:poly(hydroxyalkanoate) granule-associated protein n=1 Tax=Rhizobium TaxID=379 RepID=UPI00147891A9|nr:MULTISPECIES: poly(hydroxyalkanoate) granule-associated protein [Rhizobium]MBW8789506.1 poly(hydroxyalkanoate) granule-associated protein [Rhizobium leguminosarum]MBY5356480.1 poly(hydroxyalkanoate) granule-associated protein [Rhizobium leguminosarum]NNH44311.1 poly(hydroxyalkanoate) granule-associated protein [Rhizobium laguerreae]